jgi:mono/diheme cytochrome c family protein
VTRGARPLRRAALAALALLALLMLAVSGVWWAGVRAPAGPHDHRPDPVPDAATVARGAVLARAGNCAACHTTRGGEPYAGGRGIDTPFGTVYAGNLTPDADTGLGRWSADDFWRAFHHGTSRDGRLLTPAFPYPNFTRIHRDDADALFAFLRSLAPVRQATPASTLTWPASSPAGLAVWRALYFSPGEFRPDPARSADWNRGAYLVQGLGHCAACHTGRDSLGGQAGGELAGGRLPQGGWYAPSLTDPREAGVADWAEADIVALLKTGVSARGRVSGPMAEVVQHGTAHLPETDLAAMAVYLKTLAPVAAPPAVPLARPVSRTKAETGERLYSRHCADCHGEHGEGVAGAWPPLAGNRAVTLAAATPNLVQTVLYGGFAPATAGNPRPWGMPPFVLTLSDPEVAAVLTHLRTRWGNAGPEVTELEVNRVRSPAAH